METIKVGDVVRFSKATVWGRRLTKDGGFDYIKKVHSSAMLVSEVGDGFIWGEMSNPIRGGYVRYFMGQVDPSCVKLILKRTDVGHVIEISNP